MSFAAKHPNYRWFQCRTTYNPENASVEMGVYGLKSPPKKNQTPSTHEIGEKWEWELLESVNCNDTLFGMRIKFGYAMSELLNLVITKPLTAILGKIKEVKAQ